LNKDFDKMNETFRATTDSAPRF